MSQISLRQLARRYAEGALDKEAYRQARAEYIQAIVTGEEGSGSLTQANYTSPPVVAGEETVTAAQLRNYEQTQIITNSDPGSTLPHMQTQPIQLTDRSQPSTAVIAGVAAALLAIGIAIAIFFSNGEEAVVDSAGAQAEAGNTPAAAMQPLASGSGNPALAQLQNFLSAPQWNQQALDDFVNRWQSLPATDRETALQTTLARELGDALYRQLLEERALDGLDDTNTAGGQEKIVDFARDIGLNDRRLEIPEPQNPSGRLEFMIMGGVS